MFEIFFERMSHFFYKNSHPLPKKEITREATKSQKATIGETSTATGLGRQHPYPIRALGKPIFLLFLALCIPLKITSSLRIQPGRAPLFFFP